MKFYLGTHIPNWLTVSEFPLMVSRTRLVGRKTLPRARVSWALDSGGFTELQYHGKWTIKPRDYAAFVYRCRDEIGKLDWAAPMDWMCEAFMLAKTGLTVQEHRNRTVDNYLELRHIAPEEPILPVLQGQSLDDYRRCWDTYEARGVNLTAERVVGLGSVCRRQGTKEIADLVISLAADGLRLHGFGVKTMGLGSYGPLLTSADSMAWSRRGREVRPCAHGQAKSESNCIHFARSWRERVLEVAHV